MTLSASTMNPSPTYVALSFLLGTILLTSPTLAENRLTLQRAGQNECRVEASMENPVAGLQFTLVASESMTITSVRSGAGISDASFLCVWNNLDEHTLRVVVMGRTMSDVIRGSRELLLVNIERTSSASGPTIQLEGVVLSDGQGKGLAVTVAGLLWSEAFAPNGVAGMMGNFPNPFNPSTVISYTLNESRHVRLTVHDMLGREVVELVNEDQAAGVHQSPWMADTRTISSGVYFARLAVGGQVLVHRMAITH